jgi:arsenate reductase
MTRVLFVCTGNSARSLIAEALLRHEAGDRFEGHSAGVEPRGVNPLTIRALRDAGVDPPPLRSKSVREYLGQRFDVVVTVCDQARESCPVFPGDGERLHWSFDDPAVATGTEDEQLAVFRRVVAEIHAQVRSFAGTPVP